MKKIFSFKGTANRKEWWIFNVVALLMFSAACALDTALAGESAMGLSIPYISGLVGLLLIIPSFAVTARRFRDRGKSGWWTFIVLLPLIGPMWVIIECGLLKGHDALS